MTNAATNMPVRRALITDAGAIAQVCAEAFVDYNWMEYTIQRENRFERLRLIHELSFLEHFTGTYTWVAGDGGVDAVSIWSSVSSGSEEHEYEGPLRVAYAELAGDKAHNFFGFDDVLKPHQPTDPGFYLGVLAVAPRSQGKGLARAVLEPGFAHADKAGLPIYVDTSTPENRAMYEHFGFHVTAEVKMPGGVFTTYLMTRLPR